MFLTSIHESDDARQCVVRINCNESRRLNVKKSVLKDNTMNHCNRRVELCIDQHRFHRGWMLASCLKKCKSYFEDLWSVRWLSDRIEEDATNNFMRSHERDIWNRFDQSKKKCATAMLFTEKDTSILLTAWKLVMIWLYQSFSSTR